MAKNNFFEMVRTQAQTGREIIGVVAENKVDGNKQYKVTSYDSEKGKITLTEILPDDASDDIVAKTIDITPKNSAVIRYKFNPNEKPAPEAELVTENGKKFLIIGENKISCGTLPLESILGGVTGEVLLVTEPTEPNQETRKIVRYTVQTDEFKTVEKDFSGDLKLVTAEGMAFIINNDIREIPQKDEDGNDVVDDAGETKMNTVCVTSSLYQYKAGGNLIYIYEDGDQLWNDDDDDEDEMKKYPIDEVRFINYGTLRNLVIVTSKDYDNGSLIAAEKSIIRLFAVSGDNIGSQVGVYTVSDPDAKVFLGGKTGRLPVVTIFDKDSVLIKDGYGEKVIDDTDVVSEMDGFTTYCGTEVKRIDDEETIIYTYANDNYEVKSFSMKNTDRGTIFEIIK